MAPVFYPGSSNSLLMFRLNHLTTKPQAFLDLPLPPESRELKLHFHLKYFILFNFFINKKVHLLTANGTHEHYYTSTNFSAKVR